MGMTPTDLIVIFGAGAALVYGMLFCALVWWLVFKFVGVLFRYGDAFGHTMAIRLVSLGITAWLKPQVLTAPIDAVTAFIKSFLENVPGLIASLATYLHSTDTADISSLAGFGKKLTDTFVSALSEFLSKLQLPELMLALAVWATLGTVLSILLESPATQIYSRARQIVSRVFGRLAAVPHTTRTLSALFVIVACGGFLGISSIVAVPYLRQSAEPTEAEKAQFAAQLDESGISAEVYKDRYPADLPVPVGLSQLRERMASMGSPTSTETAASSAGGLAAFSVLVDYFDGIHNGIVVSYRNLQQKGLQRQAAERSKAVRKFATSGGRGSQERARYSNKLDTWYRSQVSMIDNELANCIKNITSLDVALNSFAPTLGRTLSWTSTGGVPVTEQMLEPLKEPLKRLGKCEPFLVGEGDPPELVPAANWGPFGTVARWLLRTGSLDLTLIAGMLGFGLLGAAISTDVRKGALLQSRNQTLISDLMGVIIRGFSAAIVVFLATMGGLAVFSVSEAGQPTEPNPYVLFLTCLAAAVFSEDVWRRVRRWLLENAGSSTADANSKTEAHEEAPHR